MGFIRRIGNYIIAAAANNNEAFVGRILRKFLKLHTKSHVLLLYREGSIEKAKSITEHNVLFDNLIGKIENQIDAIYLALTDWHLFVRQLDIPPHKSVRKPFNGQVLMLVNSCALFDQNGYAIRSTQIRKALAEVSVQTSFCARLGYPWDLPGGSKWRIKQRVASDEGMVWLKRDPEEGVGRTDPEYWNSFAGHIAHVVSNLSVKPTVLHAHSKYSNGIAAVIAGRQLGIPVVYEMRGLWHLTRAQYEPGFSGTDFFNYEERLELWAAELANSVVVISSTLKEWLIKRGIPDAKIVVIPNAPTPPTKVLPAISSEHPEILKLAFMGSLMPYEGIETVIEAVSLLNTNGFKTSFDIFGDGKYRRTLERQVKRLRLRPYIQFHGHVSRASVLKQIQNFDVFPIVRIDSEVTRLIPPMKHLDPMVAGKVVLVSELPALLENVPECVALHAVPPKNSLALAEKLQFLWSNPEERTRIGEKSYKWVVKNRNWAKNGQLYKALYENIAPTIETMKTL